MLYLNNDVELARRAVAAALRRLRSDPAIGAVGAKIVRTHGLLQEAGGIVWRDGSTSGYMRDASPLAPEANFVRDADYCSAAFLLVGTALLRELEGFDDAYAPAYYEDTDYACGFLEAGFRLVYDPPPRRADIAAIHADLPDTVEVMHDQPAGLRRVPRGAGRRLRRDLDRAHPQPRQDRADAEGGIRRGPDRARHRGDRRPAQ